MASIASAVIPRSHSDAAAPSLNADLLFQPQGPAYITKNVTPYFLVHKIGMHKSQGSEVKENLQKELSAKMIPIA